MIRPVFQAGAKPWGTCKAGSVSDPRRFVIVGASLAGAKAAETLRKEGFEGSVALVGEEAERPYERPPLSKEFLRGEAGPEKLYVHADGFYEAQGIDLRLSSTVTSLDVGDQTVSLATGERLGYDSLLLCTGARPRRLALPGADLPGVYYLRDMASSATLREAIKAAGRAVIVGAGWIGCEVAASARQLGAEVAIVEVGRLPLQKVLGPEMGRFYRDVHRDHGVEMHFGVAPEAVRGLGRRRRRPPGRRAHRPRRHRHRRYRGGAANRTGRARRLGDRQRSAHRRVPRDISAGRLRGRRTWPIRSTHCSANGSAWSIGPPPATRARLQPATCWAATSLIRAYRTFTPTSTTSVWSIRAMRRRGTR